MSSGDVVVLSSSTPTTTPDVGRQQFGEMRSDIAAYFGMDGDDAKELLVGRMIHDVIDDLNRKKLWRFNLIQATPITTVAGTDTYSVPTDLWKVYTSRKTDSVDYLLSGLSPKTMDIIFQSQNNITGYPYMRTEFNLYRTGQIRLFPIPDGAYTIVLRYFKLIAKPAAPDGTLDMPPHYQTVPKYGALARLALFNGHQSAGMWEDKYQEAYKDMNHMDEHIDDEMPRLINIEEVYYRIGYTNPSIRPRFADFY